MALEPFDHLGGASTARAVTGEHGTADDIGVAVDELRRRVDDEIGAEVDGPLQDRGGEGRVDGEHGVRFVREPGRGRDVDDVESRVARGLDPDDRGPFIDGLRQRRGIGEIDGADPDPPALILILQQPESTAVDVAGDDDLVTGAQQCREHGDLGGGARIDRGREGRVLQLAQGLFEIAAVRGARARVVESGASVSRSVHHEGRGLEDRGDDRTGVGFGHGSRVHRSGRDSGGGGGFEAR